MILKNMTQMVNLCHCIYLLVFDELLSQYYWREYLITVKVASITSESGKIGKQLLNEKCDGGGINLSVLVKNKNLMFNAEGNAFNMFVKSCILVSCPCMYVWSLGLCILYHSDRGTNFMMAVIRAQSSDI